MAIQSDSPLVVPPIPERTYDVWWIEKIYIDGNTNQTGRVSADIRLQLCYLEDGKPQFHPTEKKRIIIDDLFAEMGQNQDIANAVNSVVDLVGKLLNNG